MNTLVSPRFRKCALGESNTFEKFCLLSKLNRLPLFREPRQPLPAREQLLHGALFDLALLGDELFQRFNQRVRIA